MFEMILKGWTTIMEILSTMWPSWAAFLIGWSSSVGVTQSFLLMTPPKWNYEDCWLTMRLLAFFSAAFPAGVYYAKFGENGPLVMLLVMFFTGVWAPLAFGLFQLALRQSKRTAWIADFFAGDVRARPGVAP